MISAFEPLMGQEVVETFDELLPNRPWREVIPAEHWQRPEVRSAVAAHGEARGHLYGRLVEVIGEPHAITLMEHLVPAPWADLVRLGVPLADLVTAPKAA
jgi:hypothetical protein